MLKIIPYPYKPENVKNSGAKVKDKHSCCYPEKPVFFSEILGYQIPCSHQKEDEITNDGLPAKISVQFPWTGFFEKDKNKKS
jgi:hypothetical protein